MSVLTRHEIMRLLKEEQLVFTPPLDIYENQPHAVDLRLGTVFYLPHTWKLTPQGREILTVDVMEAAGDNLEKIELTPGQFFELAPGELVIGTTLERLELRAPDLMGVLYPRSSVNRRGLSVDMTGIVDALYAGNLIIPIHNRTSSQVIRIYPGERICQMVLHRLQTPLNEADAHRHGARQAKYTGTTTKDIASRKDCPQEIDFIRQGKLKELKDQDYNAS